MLLNAVIKEAIKQNRCKLNGELVSSIQEIRHLQLEEPVPLGDWLFYIIDTFPNLLTLISLWEVDYLCTTNSKTLQDITIGLSILRLSKKEVYILKHLTYDS